MELGVYKIVNNINGKEYIGSSTRISKRYQQHKSDLNKGRHHCVYLQRAWDKYGGHNFSLVIIKIYGTLKGAREHEELLLNQGNKELYNTSKVASGGDLISYHPNREEIVRKMSLTVQQRNSSLTSEERKIMYGSHKNGMEGKTHTNKAKRLISEAQKGNRHAKGSTRSAKQRAELSRLASQRTGARNPFYGKKHTEETKKKISKKNKGNRPINSIQVSIDGVVYRSATEASKQHNVAVATIMNRARSEKFPNYILIET